MKCLARETCLAFCCTQTSINLALSSASSALGGSNAQVAHTSGRDRSDASSPRTHLTTHTLSLILLEVLEVLESGKLMPVQPKHVDTHLIPGVLKALGRLPPAHSIPAPPQFTVREA